jgi:hypothetical protein
MTPELLTEAELSEVRERASGRRVLVKLLRAYEALVQQVSGLNESGRILLARAETAERGEADAVAALDENWVQHQRIVAAESALATEKAAREAAEKRLTEQTAGYAECDAARLAAEAEVNRLYRERVAPAEAKLERVMGVLHWLRQNPGATAEQAGDELDEALRG